MLTADQIRQEETIAASRAKFYIASVSGWDISRSDFDTELAFVQKRYQQAYGESVFTSDQGKALQDSLKAQVVSRLINEGIQMQEVQRSGYRIDPKIVDIEFAQFMKQKNLDLEKLRASLEKNGYPFDYFMKRFENQVLLKRYLDENVFAGAASDDDKQNQYRTWFNGYPFDYFMKRFENQVLLKRYLDENVFAGAASDDDKQNQYRTWFNNARGLSKVTIYDSELKQLTHNQTSGSGCGRSSGASCCSTDKS
jgi:hypothetical protein